MTAQEENLHLPLILPRYAGFTGKYKGAKRCFFFHHGAAIQPSVTRVGRTFVARTSILGEDGEATSLGDLGVFASKDGAYQFAVRCAFAFVDAETLPLPPFTVTPNNRVTAT